MKEFLSQHSLMVGIILAIIVFILNIARRFSKELKLLPTEKKFEYYMLGALNALRKLARAKRNFRRYALLRDISANDRNQNLRIYKARIDVGEAVSNYSDLLKRASRDGCPVKFLKTLENQLEIAARLKEECLQQIHSTKAVSTEQFQLGENQLDSIINECNELLSEAVIKVKTWTNEISNMEKEIRQENRSDDIVLLNTGGLFRNPFKSEDNLTERNLSESLLNLGRTRRDINRISQCISSCQKAIDILNNKGILNSENILHIIGKALEDIDIALGDAELPLLEELAGKESLFEMTGDNDISGILPVLYMNLSQIEAALYANKNILMQ